MAAVIQAETPLRESTSSELISRSTVLLLSSYSFKIAGIGLAVVAAAGLVVIVDVVVVVGSCQAKTQQSAFGSAQDLNN